MVKVRPSAVMLYKSFLYVMEPLSALRPPNRYMLPRLSMTMAEWAARQPGVVPFGDKPVQF